MNRPATPGLDFSRMWTPLVRNTLLVLGVLYVVEIIGGSPVTLLGALLPLGAGFQPWQPLTFSFVHGPPDSALWEFLAVFFLLQPAATSMGVRRLAWSTLIVWGVALVGKLAAEATGLLPGGIGLGLAWWSIALITWFGLFNRGAQILLMFVLPIRADWVAWGTGVVCLLRFGYYKDTGALHGLLAFGAAVALAYVDSDSFRRWRLLRRKHRIEKDLSKFQVIEGGKDRPRRADPQDWVN